MGEIYEENDGRSGKIKKNKNRKKNMIREMVRSY